MRFLSLALLLALAGPAAAQTPPPSMDVTLDDGRENGMTPLVNDTLELTLHVRIDCAFFAPDFSNSYRLYFEYNATQHLNVTGPDMDELGGGLCMTGGGSRSWSYDLFVDVDRRPTLEDPPIAGLSVLVRMESDDEQLAPAADDASDAMEWIIITQAAEQAAKQPPVPQEQTTPGPALPLIAGALALAALRRRA